MGSTSSIAVTAGRRRRRGGSTTFTTIDDFNRANNNLSASTTSSSGATWTLIGGTPSITSNQLTAASDSSGQIPVASADGKVRITVVTKTAQAGPYIRASTAGDWFRWVYSGTDIFLVRSIASGLTVLATAAGEGTLLANGDTLELEARGNTITCYRNGVQKAQVTDAFNNTATNIGFQINSGDVLDNLQWMA